VKGWEIEAKEPSQSNQFAIDWFEYHLDKALHELEDHFSKFRMSDALMTVYKLIWNDFCSWYLEWIKPPYGDKIDQHTYDATIQLFEKVIRMLHPFMPFITEEIWHNIGERGETDCIITAEWPQPLPYQEEILEKGDLLFEIISNIRNIRNSKGISPKEGLNFIINADAVQFEMLESSLVKMANLTSIRYSSEKPAHGFRFVIGSTEYFIESPETIDVEAEKENLEKELEYTKGFLNSVLKKLQNERFVQNAPEKVIAMEKKKKEDAEAKIKTLEDSIAKL
jgi:valyl-tRNA synthetase